MNATLGEGDKRVASLAQEVSDAADNVVPKLLLRIQRKCLCSRRLKVSDNKIKWL